EGLERRGKTLTTTADDIASIAPMKADAYRERLSSVFKLAEPIVGDAKLPVMQRQAALRLFAHATWPNAKAMLLPVVMDGAEQEIRVTALRSLAAHTDRDVPALLLKTWPSAGPAVRREILEAMLRRPERIAFLLDEIEAKRVKASEIDASRTRQLVQHG